MSAIFITSIKLIPTDRTLSPQISISAIATEYTMTGCSC